MKWFKLNLKNPSKKTMVALFFMYFSKFALECIWTFVVAMFGLFLLASISTFALGHPIIFMLCIAAGWWLINEIDWEENE